MKIFIPVFLTFFVAASYAQIPTTGNLSTKSIQVEEGWNLLSLPVNVTDGSKSSHFPTAISDAFIYDGRYKPKDTLENGFRFWVKFGSSEIIHITGEMILRDTINVRAAGI